MAVVTRDANASIDSSTGMYAPQISGLVAGENLIVGPVYIKAADGKVYQSNGTAANEAAKVDGFAARPAQIGDPVTIIGKGCRLRWASSSAPMTPGTPLFLAATAGQLDTVASIGGTVPIARAINDVDIRIVNDAT